MEDRLLIGVDLGTSGVRALGVRADGRVVAGESASLDAARVTNAAGRHEQEPRVWWEVTAEVLQRLTASLRQAGYPDETWAGLAVDGTSGTLVCLDRDGVPLRPAIMYNDARSGIEAEALNALAPEFCDRLGYRFAASYALAKIEWVRCHEPEIFGRTVRFLHQGDWLEGCLCGEYRVSDYSNALKTGYDLIEEDWPSWLDRLPGVRERLPEVVAPGTRVGSVSAAAASATGLPAGLPVMTGATDGTAACLASGVRRPGDYNTTLGTTLVFKGVSQRLGRHPQGLVYSHKLPGGLWLPGAASNTGGEWIEAGYPGADLAALDRAAARLLPTACLAYPLTRQG
ncbi:MAG: FGGY family carbohydrate kinase, partial [Candidatus Latescibacterota bacterium]